MRHIPNLADFPGGDLVAKGLSDLERGIRSEEAMLVLIAKPRLTGLGFSVPEALGAPEPYEHALYDLLRERNPQGAHSAYNALIRRIVSFAETYSISRRSQTSTS